MYYAPLILVVKSVLTTDASKVATSATHTRSLGYVRTIKISKLRFDNDDGVNHLVAYQNCLGLTRPNRRI
jgi:hypothetical protein